jgi:hypothetical protein
MLRLIASRPVGRPKIRWMDNILEDIQAIKTVNWKIVHTIEINGSQLLRRSKLV